MLPLIPNAEVDPEDLPTLPPRRLEPAGAPEPAGAAGYRVAMSRPAADRARGSS